MIFTCTRERFCTSLAHVPVVSVQVFDFQLTQRALYNVVVTCEIKLFRPSLTSDRNNLISACGNLPEIISEAYCSSRIFSSMFNVGELI